MQNERPDNTNFATNFPGKKTGQPEILWGDVDNRH